MEKQDIDEAFRTFKPGLYRHYHGGLYRAVGLVAHHETREPWVVYVSLQHGSMNIRPLKPTKGDPDGWDDVVGVNQVGVDHVPVLRFTPYNFELDGVKKTPEARMLRTLLELTKGVPHFAELLQHLQETDGELANADYAPENPCFEERVKAIHGTLTGQIASRQLDPKDIDAPEAPKADPQPEAPKQRYSLSGRRMTRCQSDDDGYCDWKECPQLRDGEPANSSRHCPLDKDDED